MACKLSSKKQLKLVLVGHCLGAILCFEVARLLQANGYLVSRLVVCAAPSPAALTRTNANRKKPTFDRRGRLIRDPFDDDTRPEALSLTSEDELLQKVVKVSEISSADLLERKHDLLRLQVPLFRADYALFESYRLGNALLDGDDVDPASLLSDRLGQDDKEDEEGEGEGADVEARRIRAPLLAKVSTKILV
jgi:surfactin synthase thioesterase subunit